MIELSDAAVRRLRRALLDVLAELPDPDQAVHASGLGVVDGDALCGSSGQRLRITHAPARVTCRRCRHSLAWDAWLWRTAIEDEGGAG